MTWKHKLSKRLSLLKDASLLVGALAACADSTLTGASDDPDAARRARTRAVASVTVSSPADSLLLDSTLQFTVVLRDAYQRILSDRVVTWSSSDTTRATVSGTGLVRGRGPGAVTITALSEGKSGSDGVIVVAPPPPAPAPVASVTVSPATASVAVGGTVQLVATARDAGGQILTGRTITWSTGNAGVATVSAQGVVTGIAAGTAGITATSEGRSGLAAVTVTAPVPPPTGSAPDILNNVSFESGWDGFLNGGGTTPSGAIARSTVRARDGSYAVGVAWDHNTADVSSQAFFDIGTGRTHLWTRTWFYATAWPNGGGFKFFRYMDGSYSKITGLQTLNGSLAIITNDGRAVYAGPLPSLNTWHSVEWEWDVANRTIAVWVDGVARTLSIYYDPGNVMSLSGGNTVLHTGSADVAVPRRLDLLRVINPTTNAGAVYFDRIAVSSLGRTGP